jgi:predicted O-methyltransferase YrrM
MSVFVKLNQLYTQYGYHIRTGLNPYHFPNLRATTQRDTPFTLLMKDGTLLCAGGGISPIEVYYLESLAIESYATAKNILIIGNSFGWSTLATGLAFKYAKVIAIDAGNDGDYNTEGNELTNRIAKDNNINAKVITGLSPDIVDKVIQDEQLYPLNFVFIDGLHTNEQAIKDFDACSKHGNSQTIYLFHDVVNWNLYDAFNHAHNKLASTHHGSIQYRTTSGMGILYPKDSDLQSFVSAFAQVVI